MNLRVSNENRNGAKIRHNTYFYRVFAAKMVFLKEVISLAPLLQFLFYTRFIWAKDKERFSTSNIFFVFSNFSH